MQDQWVRYNQRHSGLGCLVLYRRSTGREALGSVRLMLEVLLYICMCMFHVSTSESTAHACSAIGTFRYRLLVSTNHYNDVIMSATASQVTSLTIVYSIVYSGADKRKHQSSASLAFVRGIHRWPVNSPHTWPVTRKMFPFDDVIML